MEDTSPTLSHLIAILKQLDRFVGDYPLYLFLIDREYRILWHNRYLQKIFPALANATDRRCYEVFWNLSDMCEDCPEIRDASSFPQSRNVISRKMSETGEVLYLELLSLPVRGKTGKMEATLKIAFDVTKDEQARQKLRQKEKLLASIVDTSADAIFFVDNTGRIKSWNRGARNLFGYEEEEVLDRNIDILVPPDKAELGEKALIESELRQKGFLSKYETRRMRKDGTELYVEVTQTLLKDADGRPIGSSIVIRDITSRKMLEMELRRTVLELSRLNELNEYFFDTYKRDDIFIATLLAVTTGEGLNFDCAVLFVYDEEQQALKGRMAVGVFDDHDKDSLWHQLRATPRSLRDILHYYQTHLRAGSNPFEERVRRITIPLSDEGNCMIQALKKRKVILENPSDAAGKSEETDMGCNDIPEILSGKPFVLVPLLTKREIIGILRVDNHISGKPINLDEVESLKLFAHQATLAIENVRLYENLGARISELQKAYSQLEESSKKLVKAERLAALGEMASKIAHEIRNPLVSIGGFAHLLDKKLPPDSDLKRYTAIIASQVSNLETILDNILNMARPRKPHKQPVDVHQVLHKVLLMMDGMIRNKKIQVHLNFDCTKSTVWGDEKLLYQAFFNILKNSLDAMDEKGELSLRSRCDGDEIHLEIQDNGTGIPKDQLIHIYDPFFTTKSNGTGLGLAIVQEIMKDHKGRISYESELGEGTIAHVFLPRYSPREDSR